MKKRIIGFDLARAYAILGMYIVNYNIVFGSHQDRSLMGQVLSLFSGNSSTVFVMLAGMGLALMSNRPLYSTEEQKNLRRTINRRAWFLFGLGLLLYGWWPADILHFYGAYMHIAALLLFLPVRYYLWAAVAAIGVFHGLLFIIPYESAWDFENLQYRDFWTPLGFLRNTLYNGWNPVFPWLAYFTVGMYLGRLDWQLRETQVKMFALGAVLFLIVTTLQYGSTRAEWPAGITFYLQADYLPPFLPFMLSTLGFGLLLISAFMYIGNKVENDFMAQVLAKTGQMTLTHYISHLTVGMIVLALLTGRPYVAQINAHAALQPGYILLYALGYFVLSVLLSHWWSCRFKNGPLEALMRWMSG